MIISLKRVATISFQSCADFSRLEREIMMAKFFALLNPIFCSIGSFTILNIGTAARVMGKCEEAMVILLIFFEGSRAMMFWRYVFAGKSFHFNGEGRGHK